MEFKFNIGETVYCVDDMNRKYPLIIGQRRKCLRHHYNEDDSLTHVEYIKYSDEKGIGWYLEESLEK